MKTFLEKAIFVNRAPFDVPLELSFKENQIMVISAVNGQGKTTILSYIIDAIHEMVKPYFNNQFSGFENKYYRVSSLIFNMRMNEPSFVYLRFSTSNGGKIDYVDIRTDDKGICTPEQYEAAIKIKNKINFQELLGLLTQEKNIKKVTGLNPELAKAIFYGNILTYFPAYRYEQPGYLNDPYKVKLEFTKEMSIAGYLRNPLEVVTGLPEFMNWLMDLVLDLVNTKTAGDKNTYNILCNILSEIISSKFNVSPTQPQIEGLYKSSFRFGIGPRNLGAARISIHKSYEDSPEVYPSLTTLSSGESSLLCMFGELIRQADNIYGTNMLFDTIQGIVLIDEIDKHLHIRLQREVLPKLLCMFPNVQFITTSHSPFFNIGLNEVAADRTVVLSLPSGLCMPLAENPLYSEVYDLMLNEEGRFKEIATALQTEIEKYQENSKPFVITEGKTDVAHLKQAMKVLEVNDLDVNFFEHISECQGSENIKKLLKYLGYMPRSKCVVGIFDRDEKEIVDEIEKDGNIYKDYGNNVYAICLPPIEGNNECSIEHYYPDDILKKEHDGRRLFTGEDFLSTGQSKDGSYSTRMNQTLENKIKKNGVIDNGVYKKGDDKNNIALSKANFSKLIQTEGFIGNFTFENFKPIFDRLKEIPGIIKSINQE